MLALTKKSRTGIFTLISTLSAERASEAPTPVMNGASL
jgi:hypothetical protein